MVIDVFDNVFFLALVHLPFTSFYWLFVSFIVACVVVVFCAGVSDCGCSVSMLTFAFFGLNGDTLESNCFICFVCFFSVELTCTYANASVQGHMNNHLI